MTTRFEREVIELGAQLRTLLAVFESQKIKLDKTYKTVFENGLSSKVDQIHLLLEELKVEREQEKLAAVKINGEMKVLGVKVNHETRQSLISGLFIIVGIILTYYLGQ